MRVFESGPGAVLLEVDDLAQAEELYAELRRRTASDASDVVDIVPGARTVLVMARPGTGRLGPLIAQLRGWTPSGNVRPAGRLHEIAVRYDGADLAAAAAQLRLRPAEVIKLHTGTELHVAFCGFAPGFAYLAGLPEALELPRRASPRTEVPAGAVAIAGQFSAIYPRVSPGGWHILGRTTVRPWDERRDAPALLSPGDRVRFRACPS